MSALKTAPLRQQHESIRKSIDRLKRQLNPMLLASNAIEVRQGLNQLFGEFGKHLQQEAKDVYPVLAEGEDQAARDVAERFGAEMKQMLPKLAEFNKRWPTANDIRANATQFLKEADGALKWLERRFIAENNELYPLVDKLDVANLASTRNPDLKIARI
jgi:Hemerythrin HHE cation binding domain